MRPNRSLDELLETAFNAVRELQSQSDDEHRKWNDAQPFFPPSIPLDDGRNLPITQEGMSALREFGVRWRDESPGLKLAIGEAEVAKLAVSLFGELLSGVGRDDYGQETSVKKLMKDKLVRRLQSLTGHLKHYFPVQLFDEDLPGFSVGPVKFLPRVDLLEEIERHAERKLEWVSVVRDYWMALGPKPEAPRAQQQKPGLDDWTAYSFVESFGNSTWSASVEVRGKEGLRSKACSEIAVRVALDSLGLVLDPRSARELRGPGDRKQVSLDHHFSQVARRDISYSSRLDLPRYKTGRDDYDKFVNHTEDLRHFAGLALEDFVTGTTSGKADLNRRWVEAMYWYGQALREPMEFIGLVHAGVALDVLAKGSYDTGITDLCSRLMGIGPDHVVTASGYTLRKVVQLIYKDGRSQISHGGRLALLADLPYGRDEAVHFTSLVLAFYAEKLSVYSGDDDYKDFVSSLPRI